MAQLWLGFLQVVSRSLWLLLFPRHDALEVKHSAAGWKCPTPRALHARPGCCCRLHPAGPALGLAPRAESSKLPLPRQSWPGFCRGCKAPPRPGWGRKSGVRGGTGALQELSDPFWVGNCTITPLRGWGWELRAALSGGSHQNTNKLGRTNAQIHQALSIISVQRIVTNTLYVLLI